MIFDLATKKDKKIEKMYEKAMKELDSFFKLNWTRNRPKIFLMKDRKTINAFRNTKTPGWIVGWVGNGNIYVLDKKNYEKESAHKYSDKGYASLIQHELAHLFFQIISKYNHKPDWLWEGVAIYLDGKKRKRPNFKEFKDFLKFYDKKGPEVYKEAGFTIKFLVEKYGKQKLLKLIKSLPEAKNQKQFNKLFKKIYGFEPNYKKFNGWLK